MSEKRKGERNRDFNTLLIHFSSCFQSRGWLKLCSLTNFSHETKGDPNMPKTILIKRKGLNISFSGRRILLKASCRPVMPVISEEFVPDRCSNNTGNQWARGIYLFPPAPSEPPCLFPSQSQCCQYCIWLWLKETGLIFGAGSRKDDDAFA
jgi:hypothetical protein